MERLNTTTSFVPQFLNESATGNISEPYIVAENTMIMTFNCYFLAPLGILSHLIVIAANIRAGRPFGFRRSCILNCCFSEVLGTVTFVSVFPLLNRQIDFPCDVQVYTLIMYFSFFEFMLQYVLFGLDQMLMIKKPYAHASIVRNTFVRSFPYISWIVAFLISTAILWCVPYIIWKNNNLNAEGICRIFEQEYNALFTYYMAGSGIIALSTAICFQMLTSLFLYQTGKKSLSLMASETAQIKHRIRKTKQAVLTLNLLLIPFIIAWIPFMIIGVSAATSEGFVKIILFLGQGNFHQGLERFCIVKGCVEMLTTLSVLIDAVVLGTRNRKMLQQLKSWIRCLLASFIRSSPKSDYATKSTSI